jgi:GNAT superfamily N-acetyltransferase
MLKRPLKNTGDASADWAIELLGKKHDRGQFSCGRSELDDFLKSYARQYSKRNLGSTYVAVPTGQVRVVGYYTLAPSEIQFDEAPPKLIKGLPKHPIPAFLLARLAVDQGESGKELGSFLMMDAFDRCLQIAQQVSFRAVKVHTIDSRAAAYYEKFGFEPFPNKPLHFAVAIETVEDMFRR